LSSNRLRSNSNVCSILPGASRLCCEVLLSISELNVREIRSALERRRLDAAVIPSFMLWPDATALPIYCEPLVAALPVEHPFAARSALDWASLKPTHFGPCRSPPG
jgi:DNA-binding transcriptional LysR family regulator